MLSLEKDKGFTLVELITVMVILGVVASFSTGFIVNTMRGVADTSSKNNLLTKSQLSTEYMIRRLRNALPFSLRIINNGACLEFMTIVASGLYLNPLPSDTNGADPIGSLAPITVSPFTVSDGTADYLAIAAMSNNEVYGISPRSLAAIDTTTLTTITLADDKRWLRNSLTQRFYIVEAPSAFCLFNNELRLYRDLNIANTLVNSAGDYDLVSHMVEPFGNAFTLSSAIEDRNIRITLSLLFTGGNEAQHKIESVKEVVVRNVP